MRAAEVSPKSRPMQKLEQKKDEESALRCGNKRENNCARVGNFQGEFRAGMKDP